MTHDLPQIRLTLSRLKTLSAQYLADGLVPLNAKLTANRDQFNQLANDGMLNAHLNEFFAEAVKIMVRNNIAYSDINLINLYLQKNNIHQIEVK
jgi:hypothetical protein